MQTIEFLRRLKIYNTITKMLTLGSIFVGLQFFPEFPTSSLLFTDSWKFIIMTVLDPSFPQNYKGPFASHPHVDVPRYYVENVKTMN